MYTQFVHHRFADFAGCRHLTHTHIRPDRDRTNMNFCIFRMTWIIITKNSSKSRLIVVYYVWVNIRWCGASLLPKKWMKNRRRKTKMCLCFDCVDHITAHRNTNVANDWVCGIVDTHIYLFRSVSIYCRDVRPSSTGNSILYKSSN